MVTPARFHFVWIFSTLEGREEGCKAGAEGFGPDPVIFQTCRCQQESQEGYLDE